jgi:2-polyprenyl-3-methyl-5-hydroxy-6-metoxy-1,4-benzoquinol methylase
MCLSGLYCGEYVEKTYGDRMRATFDRILALPPEQSDNAGRVRRVLDFAADHFPTGHRPSLLDVGAGLGVFPFRMNEAGLDCTALDPDPQAGKHLSEVVGVRTLTGDFFDMESNALGRFDLITFNKVIEHVEDPVAMLRKAADLLNPRGVVYVEVPDVAAAAEGPGREEFFIEHHHVFSPVSLILTAERGGFFPIVIERLREPSSKFNLRAFMMPLND